MKKMMFAAILTAATLIVGCNTASNDPKAVLLSFFDALSKKDMDAARKLATSDSKMLLDMMESGMKMAKENKETDKFDRTKMEFGDAKIEGDKATVAVKEKTSGESTNFTLKKESGNWKVAFDKSSMMQMGMDKMKEKGVDSMDSLSKSMNNLKDINLDSLGDKLKDAGKMMEQNKDKINDALKKASELLKKNN